MATLKGAFLNFGAGLLGALPNIVVFQFNPTQVSRTPAIPRRPQPALTPEPQVRNSSRARQRKA